MHALNIKIGLLFSESGPYAPASRAMLAGAKIAIDEFNETRKHEIQIETVHVDPQGELSRYCDGAKHLLADHGLKHVLGCYTSWSRKEVLPLFEKHDALLWYPSHYEGFETSENTVYTGAAPNQHVIPLAEYLLKESRSRAWLVGSNYIWAWENNRIMREALTVAGGEVAGERYFPIGDIDLADVIRQILKDEPDFVFTNLIGNSQFAFIELLREMARDKGIDQPIELPVVSCSLSEAELPFLPNASDGHLSSSVYFSSIENKENASFTHKWHRTNPHLGQASADAEAAYLGVYLLAQSAIRAGRSDFLSVREAVRSARFSAPQGEVQVDAENLHCWMRPRIGRSRKDGTFDILFENPTSVRPDPYLTWTGEMGNIQPVNLKVVK